MITAGTKLLLLVVLCRFRVQFWQSMVPLFFYFRGPTKCSWAKWRKNSSYRLPTSGTNLLLLVVLSSFHVQFWQSMAPLVYFCRQTHKWGCIFWKHCQNRHKLLHAIPFRKGNTHWSWRAIWAKRQKHKISFTLLHWIERSE